MAAYSRSMGLDVGDKRIGVALSDPSGIIAQPHSTIENRGRKSLLEICDLVKAQGVQTIVVGMPQELDGNIGLQGKKVQEFVESLERCFAEFPEVSDVKTIFWDERLTSIQAERVIAGSKLKDRARRAAVDRVAAALILESFLMSKPSSFADTSD